MIKNVVFDMGGVLINCNFMRYCERCAPDADDQRLLAGELYNSLEWMQMDRGVIEADDAIASVCRRVPAHLHEAVHTIVYTWHTEATEIEGMDALVRRVKAAGYGVYLLSNAAKALRTYQQKLPGYDCFDGLFVSAEWHLLKPEIAIYRVFCDEYGLKPEECVFIDDLCSNIEGAVHAGMQGIIFRGDAERLARELQAMGVAI